jgi:phosphopantetheinyl transferase (holo-ACP synthase)
MNYDGQLTRQKGLHSLWETFIPEINLDQFMLYNPHQAKYVKNPAQALWVDIRKAHLLVPQMLAIETEVTKQFTPETKYRNQMRYGKEVKSYTKPFAEAYAKALGNTVNVQLIASANMIADFWYTAWVNAGKPELTLTRDANGNLAKELASFKRNKLIQDGLLISKKDKPED